MLNKFYVVHFLLKKFQNVLHVVLQSFILLKFLLNEINVKLIKKQNISERKVPIFADILH